MVNDALWIGRLVEGVEQFLLTEGEQKRSKQIKTIGRDRIAITPSNAQSHRAERSVRGEAMALQS